MYREYIEVFEIRQRWIYFLTFFGLCTVKETGRAEHKIRYVTCKLKIGFCIFHIILFGLLFGIQIAYGHETPYNFQAPGYLNELIGLSGFPAAILIILSEIFHTKSHGILLTNTTNFEMAYVQKDAGSVLHQRAKKFFCLVLLVLLFSLACDFFHLHISNWDVQIILDMIPDYVQVLYSLISVLQFSTLQFWLQRSFIKINEDLRHFCELSTQHDLNDITRDATLFVTINNPQVNEDDDDVSSRKVNIKITYQMAFLENFFFPAGLQQGINIK